MFPVTHDVQPFFGGLDVHVFQLSNGLQLKVVHDTSAPVVAIQTWFRVGSAREEVGRTGLAHLFEHLMFKGTADYPDGAFQARLDSLGATGLNAWTWLDQTVYTEAVPKAALAAALAMEASRMHRLELTPEVFEAERQVVMNERRMAVEDDPAGKMSERHLALAYDRHPYGWPTIGWMEDIERLSLEDVRAFYRKWYAPDQATLLLVGDVEPAEARALVESIYGAISPAHTSRPPLPVEPEQRAIRRGEITLPLATDRVLIGFKIPEYTHPDMPALLVLDIILGAGRTGRLSRALVDRGLAIGVSSGVLPLSCPSLLELDVRARPGISAETLESAVWEEVERLIREGVSEGELAKGVALWRKGAWSALGSASGKAEFLGWSSTHTGDHRDGIARLEAIRQMTCSQVKDAAARYLRSECATVLVGRAAPAHPEVALPPARIWSPEPLISVGGRALSAAPLGPQGLLERRPLGAATLLSLYDGRVPIVRFHLIFPAGSRTDPPDKSGRAMLAGLMLLRGTTARSREHFEAALEQLGASLNVSIDGDDFDLHGSALVEHWPALLALLREALLQPAWSPEELAQLVEESAAEFASLREDDGWLVWRQLLKVHFGAEHPYGRMTRGTPESLRAVTVDDLVAYHRDYLRANGVIVGVAGAADAATLGDLDALLGALAGTPPSPAPLPPLVTERPCLWLIDKPDRTQVQVRAIVESVEATDPDYPAFLLANDIFGVGFTSRLMREVREARGWSYSTSSAPYGQKRLAQWTLDFAPALEQLPEALTLVQGMVKEAVEQGFTELELEQVRAARLAARPFLADTIGKRLYTALVEATTGHDILGTVDRMEGVSLHEVNAAFARAIAPDRMVWAMTAPATALREELETRFGAASVIDYREV